MSGTVAGTLLVAGALHAVVLFVCGFVNAVIGHSTDQTIGVIALTTIGLGLAHILAAALIGLGGAIETQARS